MTNYVPKPPCAQNRTNCFSNIGGCCAILNDTKFKYECPFYKDLIAYREELWRLGLKLPR